MTEDGKVAGIWIQGALCYTAVIFTVTMKVLADSYTINWVIILLDLASIGVYFLCFWLEAQFSFFSIFGHFHQSFEFYIHGATIFFTTFFIFVINQFLSEMDRLKRENQEIIELERLEELDMKRKSRLSQMQASISAQMDKSISDGTQEGPRQMTKSKSRIELLTQRQYTGFAFSQEAGNVSSLNDIVFNTTRNEVDQ